MFTNYVLHSYEAEFAKLSASGYQPFIKMAVNLKDLGERILDKKLVTIVPPLQDVPQEILDRAQAMGVSPKIVSHVAHHVFEHPVMDRKATGLVFRGGKARHRPFKTQALITAKQHAKEDLLWRAWDAEDKGDIPVRDALLQQYQKVKKELKTKGTRSPIVKNFRQNESINISMDPSLPRDEQLALLGSSGSHELIEKRYKDVLQDDALFSHRTPMVLLNERNLRQNLEGPGSDLVRNTLDVMRNLKYPVTVSEDDFVKNLLVQTFGPRALQFLEPGERIPKAMRSYLEKKWKASPRIISQALEKSQGEG